MLEAPVVEKAPPASDKQRRFIAGLQDDLGWHSEYMAVFAKEQGVDLVSMTVEQASALIQQMQRLAKEEVAPALPPPAQSPADDGLQQLADTVKRLREAERTHVAEPPVFSWNKKQGKGALETEREASRGRLHAWLSSTIQGAPTLDELDDAALIDAVYTTSGL